MRIENLDTKDTIIFNFDSQDIKGLRGVCNSISMPGDFYSKRFSFSEYVSTEYEDVLSYCEEVGDIKDILYIYGLTINEMVEVFLPEIGIVKIK